MLLSSSPAAFTQVLVYFQLSALLHWYEGASRRWEVLKPICLAPGVILHFTKKKTPNPLLHCVSAPVDYKELREGKQPIATGEMQHVGEKRGVGANWVTGHFPSVMSSLLLLWPDEISRLLPPSFISSQINTFSVSCFFFFSGHLFPSLCSYS